jgi:Na+/proline symporter
LSDIQAAFPNLNPALLGNDIAYPAMLKFLPAGFIGLMVGGLVAANSSTILTHLNWGASYLVHDFYRRFINHDATEKHYVLMGRAATILLFVLSSGLVFVLDSAKGAFDIILQVGAGTGLLYLLRWFWWRVNAWSEVVAMISSFLISIVFLVLERQHIYATPTAARLVITVAATTVCWVLAAYLAPQTDRQTLLEFYTKVRPAGPGWEPIRKEAGLSKAEVAKTGDSIPMALVGWVAGCTMIWSALFTVGNFLYGRSGYAVALAGVFAVSGLVLIRVVNRLWATKDEAATLPAEIQVS